MFSLARKEWLHYRRVQRPDECSPMQLTTYITSLWVDTKQTVVQSGNVRGVVKDERQPFKHIRDALIRLRAGRNIYTKYEPYYPSLTSARRDRCEGDLVTMATKWNGEICSLSKVYANRKRGRVDGGGNHINFNHVSGERGILAFMCLTSIFFLKYYKLRVHRWNYAKKQEGCFAGGQYCICHKRNGKYSTLGSSFSSGSLILGLQGWKFHFYDCIA